MEKILSIQQAADYLGCHYSTIFERRAEFGFRLPGGRKWFIPVSSLENLARKGNNVFRLSLQVGIRGNELCRSTENLTARTGGLISSSRTERELDALLAQKTAGKRRNTTTG